MTSHSPNPIRLAAMALSVALAACSSTSGDDGPADAGGLSSFSCDSPEDCRAAGFEAVCRQGLCKPEVPCGVDAECGLGESCLQGQCRFTGCTRDQDCAVGRCRTEVFSCTQCASSSQCPAEMPVCTDEGRCIQCSTDADCPAFGPGFCDPSGACVHCLRNDDCPLGLNCGPRGVCTGAKKDQKCSEAIACDEGLTCVTVGGTQTKCLEACNLFKPGCTNGEICVKLTFQDSPSLVFDQGAPLGVCFPPVSGAHGYHEDCTQIACQPNLECVPDSSARSTCKTYCDPEAKFCASNEDCFAWPGDYSGHQYGVCYAKGSRYHQRCARDADCGDGMRCLPDDDPTEPLTEVGMFCAFASGPKEALAPCAGDADCGSGRCAADLGAGADFQFCFGACTSDDDCSIGGRVGTCDTDYTFATDYNDAAAVRGCRPTCVTPSDCAGFGAQPGTYACLVYPTSPEGFSGKCNRASAAGVEGDPCANDWECREGLCLKQDARGVGRSGVCTHPCRSGTDCSALSTCEDRTMLLWAGTDGLAGTGDDLRSRGSSCGGARCSSDADCGGALPVCAADLDPADPNGGQLVTACRAPAPGTKRAGETCAADPECRSGACADLRPPSTGTGRTCLEPCSLGGGSCGQGMTCRAGAARLKRPDGTTQDFTACVP